MNSITPSLGGGGGGGVVTTADWTRFLKPLVFAVPNPPTEDEFKARVSAIAFALPGLPPDMLTAARQREAMRRFKFFPGPAELAEWLGPDLADHKRISAGLALAAPTAEPRGPRTVAEILAVREKVQAFMAERNQAPGGADLPPVQPRYLSDGALIASLEHAIAVGGPGVEASRLRLNALRARQAQMARQREAGQ